MRILIVSRGLPSEKYPLLGIFEFDQAKALAKLGHEVIFVAIDLRSIRRLRKFGMEQFDQDGMSIFICNFPGGRLGNKVLDCIGEKCFKKVYNNIKSQFGKPDIVHAHFSKIAVYTLDLCLQEDLPLVITEHSSQVNRKVLPAQDAKRLRWIYQGAKKVIAVSSALASNIEIHAQVEAQVIPNILDLSLFDNEVSAIKTGDKFRFLSAANLVEIKGFDVLLKAYSLLKKKYEDVSLKIMGGGPEYRKLVDLCSELGIEDVDLSGSYLRPEFAKELSHTNAFVLPSRSETFGVVYAEAIASGVPVIATRCGGPEDFVDETNGLLVPVDDVRSLVDAMEIMYLTASNYDSDLMSQSAREKFSPEAIAKQIDNVYKEIINVADN